MVAASSSVVTTGVQADIGTGLQLPAGAFLDVGRLLRESCAVRGARERSTFTRSGKGGLPPSPDRPLASLGEDIPEMKAAGTDSAALAADPASTDVCG